MTATKTQTAPSNSDPQKGLIFDVDGGPDFAKLRLTIPKGQHVKAESSAMISMDTNISMKTRLKGGFKRFLTGESLFLNEFSADGSNAEIEFAHGLPGDIKHVRLGAEHPAIFLQSGSFLACSQDVVTDSKFQGLVKGFFSGAGLFLIRCSGEGDLFFNSYGSILPLDVEDDMIIDNNHIVAFTEGLEYNVTKAGGYKSLFFSGEALVTRFRGQGRVWVQTRKFPSFAWWIWPFRRVQKKSD